jgi:Ser/Thr protein kinase RdoA (MazF antagonist)
MSSLSDFSHLTPDHVLGEVERVLDARCTNLCRPLNSYINRVYEIELERGDWVIAKFYRPGRWSDTALGDELTFLTELAAEEIPVVAPLVTASGPLHRDHAGVRFTLFPKKGGRPLVEPSPERWIELGRLLGRVHAVGSRHPPRDRAVLHPERLTLEHLDTVLAADFPYESLRLDYADAGDDLLDLISPLFDDVELIRVHGDLHAQNLLERADEPLHLIDFDDMVLGPAVQDIWMLLPDRPERCHRELNLFSEGYEVFRAFPDAELKLIEPLRAMRYLHFAAWCARQKADGGFNRLAPDWGSEAHWKRELEELRRQIRIIEQNP